MADHNYKELPASSVVWMLQSVFGQKNVHPANLYIALSFDERTSGITQQPKLLEAVLKAYSADDENYSLHGAREFNPTRKELQTIVDEMQVVIKKSGLEAEVSREQVKGFLQSKECEFAIDTLALAQKNAATDGFVPIKTMLDSAKEIKKSDTNKDGLVNLADASVDLCALKDVIKKQTDGFIKAIGTSFLNDDLKNLIKKIKDPANIDKLDKNSDGKISFPEFAKSDLYPEIVKAVGAKNLPTVITSTAEQIRHR